MAIYAVRRENETIEKLIGRMKKQVQHKRLVQRVRTKRYFVKKLTKRLVKNRALKRESNRDIKRKEVQYA